MTTSRLHRLLTVIAATALAVGCGANDGSTASQSAPAAPTRLFTVPDFTEGVVFDRDGNGYVSSGKYVIRFKPDGTHATWAETGGTANGHKILADGTHLVCDRSQKAVLHLSADGKILGTAASECDGKPLRVPNDLTLDVAHAGFYFTDPEFSDLQNPIGTVHYVDAQKKVHFVDGGMAYPNGIALTPDGKRLYVGESITNRVHVYDVLAPGKVGPRRLLADLPKPDPMAGHIDGQPDGLCLDAAGNVYVAHFGMGRVEVLSPDGKGLRSIPAGNITASNVAFGGPEMDQLFVTGALGPIGKAEGAVFRVVPGAKGQVILPK